MILEFRRYPRRTPVITGLVLLGMILASGCVFEPRKAPDPSGNQVPWIRPDQVVNVMANLREAVNALHDPNYDSSVAPDFVFWPSSVDAAEAPAGYFDGFGKERELNALRKLFTQVDSLRVQWIFDANDDLTEYADSALLELDYQLFVSYTGTEQRVFESSARFKFSLDLDDNIWLLQRWDESGFNATQSWGRLRANLEVYQ